MLKAITGFMLILLFAGLYLYLEQSGLIKTFFNQQALEQIVGEYNQWGPFVIILLMTGAIVMSPLPSAPIALVSGAMYGHTWGTVYVLIGAELGAIIAFSMARLLGYESMQKKFGQKITLKWLQSENNLMWIIGISRLIPFISFDVVSYAAGLTPISTLRFALATLVGIIPASFLLAHFGSEMASSDLPIMTLTVIVLGGITGVPFIIGLITRYRHRKKIS